ncbi:hypothetical protein L596_013541 [Steinernema carpocapsae]|uniref:Uncharacterized protein n=1 Tax=Steinernema carpocapsae TaxID=34508 RepID=A0A4U5P0G5_STECR|nr:hypothetical protein L596_013541 [Steinernema carpocapsae]
MYYSVPIPVRSIEPKNAHNRCLFDVCNSNCDSVAVAKPTGPSRRRKACKRQMAPLRNPRLLNQDRVWKVS